MGQSVQKPLPPMELNSVDRVRPREAAAAANGQRRSIALTAVVKDALIRHYGSLKAAAISLEMDQGQLTRELQTGDFKLLRRLEGNDDVKMLIARAMYEAFGDDDPKARRRQLIREVRQRLDELADAEAP